MNHEDILLDEENTAVMLRRKGQALIWAVLQGMATDMVREIYEEMGVTAASISLGGNVLVIDPKSQEKTLLLGCGIPEVLQTM